MHNLIAVLRPYWKSLQSLNDDDTLSLGEFLQKWDDEHRKTIKFYSNDHRPEQFDLTGFYPLYPEEENQRLDKEIDRLIEITDLKVPTEHTCYAINEKSSSLDIYKKSENKWLTRVGFNLQDVIQNVAQGKVIQFVKSHF